jgi:hypothetical protein
VTFKDETRTKLQLYVRIAAARQLFWLSVAIDGFSLLLLLCTGGGVHPRYSIAEIDAMDERDPYKVGQ